MTLTDPVPPAPPFPSSPPPYYPPAATKNSGKAVASLILSLVNLFVCPVVPAIVALILAGQAKKEIAASGGMITGEGLAKAGKIISIIGLILQILGTIALILLVVFFGSASTSFSFSSTSNMIGGLLG